MPQRATHRVLGYEALVRACDMAGRDTKRFARETFRATGRHVQRDATRKFDRYSSKTAAGYRTVVRVRGVSVEQSLRKTTGLRSDYGALQMRKALVPALEENEPLVEREFEQAMDKVAAHFERAGRLMDWIVIEGVRPWDGRYEFDLEGRPFTTREWGWLKRFPQPGYMPLTLEDGFAGADPELFSCFALIALHRAGKVEIRDMPQVWERFLDAPFEAAISVESDTDPAELEEADAGPPAGKLALKRERAHFWARFTDEFGELDGRPCEAYWDARLGYFGVGPGIVGDLTPQQLLGCIVWFSALHEAG